jgi:Ammonia permease
LNNNINTFWKCFEGGEFMDTNLISSLIDEKVFGVWFLIGAALVFWMQAGFAMVECGFARAKNAGNIIMKNLMDFCIGTVVFIAIASFILVRYASGIHGKTEY